MALLLAGNTVERADKASCDKAYNAVRKNSSSPSSALTVLGRSTTTSFLKYPSARKYVERLFREVKPDHDAALPHTMLRYKLAVVTGVAKGSPGYHVAEELGITARMDVVLMGRSAKQLQLAADSIHRESEARGMRPPELYRVRIDRSSLRSVVNAAEEVEQLCHDHYGGRLHVLVHCDSSHPAPVKDHYETTEEGVDVNVGTNYLAPRLLADLLLPVLRAAATQDYKPRIVQEASLGHCQGADFDPDRLRKRPSQGGAPEKCFQIRQGNEKDNSNGETGTSLEYANSTTGLEMYYRSKMALIADTMALAKEEPMLSVVSFYSGVLPYDNTTTSTSSNGSSRTRTLVGSYFSNDHLSPSQGARAALRAALDPSFNTEKSLQGAYLHCDGNPWTVADPTVLHPLTGKPYDLEEYAETVRAVGDELCGQLRADQHWEWELQLQNLRSMSCSKLLQQSSQASLLHAASYSSILSQ